MNYWIFICVFLFVNALFSTNKKFEKSSGIVAFAVLLFFSFFRAESVGTDTINYVEDLVRGGDYSNFSWRDSHTYEAIYQGLRYYMYVNGWSGIWLTRFFSLCTFIVLYITTRRFKVNAAIVALMLMCTTFYPLSMNVARQIVSVSFLLLGYSYLFLDQNKIKYCICVFTAVLFHTSSLFFIALVFFPNLKIKKQWLYLMMVIVFICSYVLNISILGTVLEHLPFIHYANKYGDDIRNIESHNIFGIAQNGITLLFSILALRNSPKTEKTDIYDTLYGLSYSITALFAVTHSNIQRMAFGFSIFSIIYYAYYFAYSNDKMKKIAVCCVIAQLIWVLNAMGHGTWEVEPFIFDFTLTK